MFKRSTKITSLLVAAASVISMVPAMAADVKKVDDEEGKVYHAIAYKDGQGYLDGSVNDKDDATYYIADGKFNELDDVDTDSEVKGFDSKYVSVDDGDYTIDLTTGKVTDDDTLADNNDDAKANLKKKIKKDDDGRVQDKDVEHAVTELTGNKFNETWYEASYKLKNSTDTIAVYTNKDGKYIDGDYNLGKIKVVTTSGSSSKTTTIENSKDTYDSVKKEDGLKASYDTAATVIAQDDKFIYRRATIKVEVTDAGDTSTIKSINGIEVNDSDATSLNAAADGKSVTFDVIQKISKDQSSDDVDGLKYAKTATCYVISNDSAKTETLLADESGAAYAGFKAVNGKLLSYRVTGGSNSGNIKAECITLKSKEGFYYTDLSDGGDTDIESSDAWDYDVDGNLWALDGGYVKQFDNDEDWNKVYKVNGSMTKISVYDKDNMIVWDEDDECYSLIGGKTKEEEPAEPETPAVTAGWNQAADGTYTYVNADGTKATGWLQSPASGKWFYMDPTTGVMQTGWQQVGGTWYYMNPSNGDMQTGWVAVNGTWYFMNGSGAMQTGWVNDGNAWYYMDASGAMLSNTTVDGYVLGASGAWVK